MREDVLNFTDADVAGCLEWGELVDALDDAFKRGAESPPRPHFDIEVPGEPNGNLLLMPAWVAGRHIGLKTVTVFPGNAARNEPSVNAQYLLFSAATGAIVAVFEGGVLTVRRTAAASALASRYLSRADARRLLIVGTGRLSSNLASAHASVRTFEEIVIWGRDAEKARKIAGKLADEGLPARPAGELRAEVEAADIISCCTLARAPIIKGEWLKPGAHLDLVGAFTPQMREADEAALMRSRVFVDTFEGALSESGELVHALNSGALARGDIQASLFELTRGEHSGREGLSDITLFKSVGCSLEDLAAAELCVARSASRSRDATAAV
ncbi:ornithine cyclodeaminase family protein [Nitratireductor sp. CAU 1489]|uniref:Ornithine cyclodeaminase family protein n=2 Tax=Nitratireductor arenosus TaxID=2682096 RepID=A0A844QL47_9HYPH|nr:ornithine cyclodeaminase family protein [Nitratireductor arenosus]MVA98359.1 ornithine cyclodeaminase family protein [Nitratireductor arenosus]